MFEQIKLRFLSINPTVYLLTHISSDNKTMRDKLLTSLPNYLYVARKIYRNVPQQTVRDEIQWYTKRFNNLGTKMLSFDVSWASHLHKLRPQIYANDLKTGKVSFDLIKAQERQMELLKHISYNIFSSSANNQKMVDNYFKFMDLFFKTNNTLVPSKNIDVVWHLHLDDHENYKSWVIGRYGRLIDHNDEISFEKLKKSAQETSQLWNSNYNFYNFSDCGSTPISIPSYDPPSRPISSSYSSCGSASSDSDCASDSTSSSCSSSSCGGGGGGCGGGD